MCKKVLGHLYNFIAVVQTHTHTQQLRVFFIRLRSFNVVYTQTITKIILKGIKKKDLR